MSFEPLGLSPDLMRAIKDQGYTEPTPVQEQAIPLILEGRDLMARAQTGTGKTAGFTLPLLQLLGKNARSSKRRGVRALILAPTRELANQVRESVRTYGRHLPLKSLAVFGGVGFGPQAQALRRGVDVLVATPGRLLDHLSQRTVDLSGVEILVLDEADRMLDMGFINDIRKIMATLPSKRQNLLFSATLSSEIQKLANNFLTNPMKIEIAPREKTADRVTQVVHPVDRSRKTALLTHRIVSESWKQVLVFTRTKRGADRLTKKLRENQIATVAIHSDKTQGARTRALADFKRGATRVLVATDIAARGLDIEQLPHVVNFDLPYVAEDYVHRIGRTGRAGMDGQAISLVCGEEHKLLQAIERLLEKPLPKEKVTGFEPSLREDVTRAPRGASSRPDAAQRRGRPGHPARPAFRGKRVKGSTAGSGTRRWSSSSADSSRARR